MDDELTEIFGKAIAALNAREAERQAQDRALLLALAAIEVQLRSAAGGAE